MTHKTKVALWALTLFTVISVAVVFLGGFLYTATKSLKASLIVIAIAFAVYLFGCYRSIVVSGKKRYGFIWSLVFTVIANIVLLAVITSKSAEHFSEEERIAGFMVISIVFFFAMIIVNIGAIWLARKLAPLRMKAKMAKESYEVSRPHCFRCGKPLGLLELKCRSCGYSRISFKNNDE